VRFPPLGLTFGDVAGDANRQTSVRVPHEAIAPLEGVAAGRGLVTRRRRARPEHKRRLGQLAAALRMSAFSTWSLIGVGRERSVPAELHDSIQLAKKSSQLGTGYVPHRLQRVR
jgi:hypothetical protein